jgi:DNA-binding XRE family transcriptional regulator
MLMPPGSYFRVLGGYAASARFGTSLVIELPTTRRVRMMERSRSTPLPGLAEHRRRRGLTQRQLGEISGVAHTTVQQLESLKRGAYPQTLRKLAIALRVEPKDLQ